MTNAEARLLAQQQLDEHHQRYMTSPETVPELLLGLHERGISYKRIADEIGVTYMAVWRWRKGFSTPRPIRPVNEKLMAMGIYLDVQNRANEIAKRRWEAEEKAPKPARKQARNG